MTSTYRVEPGFSMRVRPSFGLGFDSDLSANSGLEMAERGRTWGDSETAKLLELWSEEGIQAQLRGMMRNEVPFRKIAEELEKGGYKRTFTQCREKIKALKKKHKEVVDRLRKSGVGTESDEEITVDDFKWFADVHRVMKTRAIIYPPHVVDSATYKPVTPSHSFSRADTEDVHSVDSSHSDAELEESSQLLGVTDNGSGSVTKSQSSLPAPTHGNKRPFSTVQKDGAPSKTKKNTLTKIDKAERASNDIVDKLLQAQKEERERAADMEQERKKWEEEKEKKEAEREGVFLGLFSQLIARLAPPQQPLYTQQPPCVHPTQPILTQSQQMPGPSHANMYTFGQIDETELP